MTLPHLINNVSPKGEGGGYKKCPKRRRSLVDLRRQGEGGSPKNLKFGETSFMGGLLGIVSKQMRGNSKGLIVVQSYDHFLLGIETAQAIYVGRVFFFSSDPISS